MSTLTCCPATSTVSACVPVVWSTPITFIPQPIAYWASDWPMRPKPTTARVMPRNSRPLPYAFFKALNCSPPSTGMRRLLSCKKRLKVKRWPMTNSATLCELAAGVLLTCTPFDRAYATSMLSIPTPPRMMNLRFGHASISGSRTLVALRTSRPSTCSELMNSASSSAGTKSVQTRCPAVSSAASPAGLMPSLAKIFMGWGVL